MLGGEKRKGKKIRFVFSTDILAFSALFFCFSYRLAFGVCRWEEGEKNGKRKISL